MKRILITGAAGFVAEHFMDFLRATRQQIEVLGIDVSMPASMAQAKPGTVKFHFKKINLLERTVVDKIVREFSPDRVLHLAAFSSVAFSWVHPVESFCNNTNIFLNLLEALRTYSPNARFLSVGSSQVYGAGCGPRKLRESDPLLPTSPYGIARVSQEMLGKIYATNMGMNIVLTRSFNHVGVGQKPEFVISSFVRQFAAARKKGSRSLDLRVGNIHVARDFTDVKDVVRAYVMLLKSGRRGECYNVCSGRGVSLRQVIALLEKITGVKARIVVDKTLFRPGDPKKSVGDYSKIHAETGWEPRISLKDTLSEMLHARGS